MLNEDCLLAIDQGTTGTTAVLVSQQGEFLGKTYRKLTQIYPQPGWVEHDPLEIWQTVQDTISDIDVPKTGRVQAVGITNQRETTIVWDKDTREPVSNAIVWQCRRTAEICESLKAQEDLFRAKQGSRSTPISAALNSSGSSRTVAGRTGTIWPSEPIDTWLIWKLTQEKVHATDYTNASRTLLFNIFEKRWDKELVRIASGAGVNASRGPKVAS